MAPTAPLPGVRAMAWTAELAGHWATGRAGHGAGPPPPPPGGAPNCQPVPTHPQHGPPSPGSPDSQEDEPPATSLSCSPHPLRGGREGGRADSPCSPWGEGDLPRPPRPAALPRPAVPREGEVVSLRPVPEGLGTLFPGEEGDRVRSPPGAGWAPGRLPCWNLYLFVFILSSGPALPTGRAGCSKSIRDWGRPQGATLSPATPHSIPSGLAGGSGRAGAGGFGVQTLSRCHPRPGAVPLPGGPGAQHPGARPSRRPCRSGSSEGQQRPRPPAEAAGRAPGPRPALPAGEAPAPGRARPGCRRRVPQ